MLETLRSYLYMPSQNVPQNSSITSVAPKQTLLSATTPISNNKMTNKSGQPLSYLGQDEWEFWKDAPLVYKDIYYLEIKNKYNINDIIKAFPEAHVKISHEGRLVISSEPNQIKKESLLQWFEDNGIIYSGFKYTLGVKRRDLGDLEAGFLKTLVKKGTELAIALIYSKHKSYISQVLDDMNDLPSYAAEIVLTLAITFNPDKKVPFLAYLSTMLGRKIQDISRAQTGRILTDFAIAYNRAIKDNPGIVENETELAASLKISVEQLRKRVSQLQERRSINSPQSLYYAPYKGSAEDMIIDLPTGEDYNIETRLLRMIDIEKLHHSIQTVAKNHHIILKPELTLNNVLAAKLDDEAVEKQQAAKGTSKLYSKQAAEILIGFKATYLKIWESKTSNEVSQILGVSLDLIRASEKRYYKTLREALSENQH